MKYAIRSALSVLFFSLLLGCGGEERVLAPEGPRFTSAAVEATGEVSDPVGDAVASDGSGVIGEAYQDIVSAGVSKKGRTFVFAIHVAASLPSHPTRPHQKVLQEWSWNLNTDPSTFPAGFPFAPGTAAPPEFIVLVLWDGRSMRASVIDRRPLLKGERVTITPAPFHIRRGTVTVSVGAGALGNPESFFWVARTNNWLVRMGKGDPQTLDRAPDSGQATWTQ
jgi:hypothetical protein